MRTHAFQWRELITQLAEFRRHTRLLPRRGNSPLQAPSLIIHVADAMQRLNRGSSRLNDDTFRWSCTRAMRQNLSGNRRDVRITIPAITILRNTDKLILQFLQGNLSYASGRWRDSPSCANVRYWIMPISWATTTSDHGDNYISESSIQTAH